MGNRSEGPGLGAWLVQWLGSGGWKKGARGEKASPRLAVVERIPLAARHQLALVEADGERILVALAADGRPVFHALEARRRTTISLEAAQAARRISC